MNSTAISEAPSGTRAMVHKKDCEGAIEMDTTTGLVTTSLDERPEWAMSLAAAQLPSRDLFYERRLGKEGYTEALRHPGVYAFEDLDWVSETGDTDASGEPKLTITEADDEHRMEVLANLHGLDREREDLGIHGGVQVYDDNKRDDGELVELLDNGAKLGTSGSVMDIREHRKTGTHGE